MNIFSALRLYAGKWNEKASRAFSSDEIQAVDSAKVVESQYGLSVCFMMKSGGMAFIPLDMNSSLGVGADVDLSKAELVTLGRPGEQDIYRVRA